MASFPCDYILQRKIVTKIWQKIIIVFSFIRYVNVWSPITIILSYLLTHWFKERLDSLKNIILLSFRGGLSANVIHHVFLEIVTSMHIVSLSSLSRDSSLFAVILFHINIIFLPPCLFLSLRNGGNWYLSISNCAFG